MSRPSKIVFGVAGVIAALLVVSWIASFALSLMNQKSDLSVGIGAIILTLILAGIMRSLIAVGNKIKEFINGKNDNKKGEEQVPKILSLLLIGLLPFLGGCAGCTRVPPGYVGILVSYAGSNRGVADIPIVTGWAFYNPASKEVLEYPTFVQTAVWTHNLKEGAEGVNEEISFNSSEGLMLAGDLSLSYMLRPERIPHFYVKFRTDDLSTFTHGYLRNVARDIMNEVAGRYPIEDLYGLKKEEFLVDVRKKLNKAVEAEGVVIEQFGFISAPRPPPSFVETLNAKVSAVQLAMKAENELRQAEAEAKKVIAKAEGEAEANKILTASITPNLIQWRQLEFTKLAIEKWNGQRPMVEGGTGGGGFLINIPINK